MKANSIISSNFLNIAFKELPENRLADICFNSSESMTEFYDHCFNKGIKAIKIESSKFPEYYHLQYVINTEKDLENLKIATTEITLNS